MLIRILEASCKLALAPGFGRIMFDMSVGYDLAGIRGDRVQAFIRGMIDATPVVEGLRRELPPELGPLRDLDFPTRLSDTLTLSSFHGCPPDEIETMVEHLMRDHGLGCVVKLNPTLLGAAEVRRHDALGYTDLRSPDAAFEGDAAWEQAAAFMDRLGDTTQSLGLGRSRPASSARTSPTRSHSGWCRSPPAPICSRPAATGAASATSRSWRCAWTLSAQRRSTSSSCGPMAKAARRT